MNNKRDRLQVIYDILKVIQSSTQGIKPTHIMYKANLSSQMLNEYLTYLKEQKLILEDIINDKKKYSLTNKGHNYLAEYGRVTKFMSLFGLNE